MDPKREEQLRVLTKARKRAEKVLAERREAEQKALDLKMRKQANQELMKQYAQELNALAQACGILALAEEAALERGGSLTQLVSYYVDYGFTTSRLHRALITEQQGELRAAYLALSITWGPEDDLKEVEIRINKRGEIKFHHCFLPVLAFFWRRDAQLLRKMLAQALKSPRKK